MTVASNWMRPLLDSEETSLYTPIANCSPATAPSIGYPIVRVPRSISLPRTRLRMAVTTKFCMGEASRGVRSFPRKSKASPSASRTTYSHLDNRRQAPSRQAVAIIQKLLVSPAAEAMTMTNSSMPDASRVCSLDRSNSSWSPPCASTHPACRPNPNSSTVLATMPNMSSRSWTLGPNRLPTGGVCH